MSVATVITEGFGSFGNVPFVVTEGYGPFDPVVSSGLTHGGSKAKRKVRGPYSDPSIYDAYIARCVAERNAPRADVALATLKESLVSEVEQREQTGYAEFDALTRENQILQRLVDLETTRKNVAAIQARRTQIAHQLQKHEDDEMSMLLAAFDEL